jgi:perosamine synthetase
VKIPVYKPQLNGNEKKYVNNCLETSWISSRGEYVSRFEAKFTEFCGCPHAATVCNGTVALHLALAALGIGRGDEVIVPTLTYIATVNMIILAGATPVFVDSQSDTWNLDPVEVTRKITNKTRAVMAVHLYGQPCELDSLRELCMEHNLYLIEDCAEAFGSYYKGKHVGGFGDVSTFSFFGNKTITTGEGGMVCAASIVLHDKVYHLKTQAVSPSIEYYHDTLGFNYRMTNICAAIGLAQLENAIPTIARKNQIAHRYLELFEGLPLFFQSEAKDTVHSYWMFSIALDNAKQRDPLRKFLQSQGIETRPIFYPAHTLPHCHTSKRFPIAERLSKSGLNLPSYPGLSDAELEYVGESVRKFLA